MTLTGGRRFWGGERPREPQSPEGERPREPQKDPGPRTPDPRLRTRNQGTGNCRLLLPTAPAD